MNRVEVDIVVQSVSSSTGALSAAASASVQINARNDNGSSGAAATLYTTPDLSTTKTNPLITDSVGRLDAWVDQGSYNLVVSGSGIAGYTQPWEAVPASGLTTGLNSVGAPQIMDLSVGASELAANAVTTAKISDSNVTLPKISSSVWPGVNGYGLDSAKPTGASVAAGYLYYSTDIPGLYRYNGATWDSLSGSSSAAIKYCSVYRSTATSTNPVGWDYELYDNDNIHDNVTNNSRLTCKTAGLYAVGAVLPSSSAGYITGLRKNGSTLIAGNYTYYGVTFSAIVNMAVNDYMEIINLNGVTFVADADKFPTFWMARISS